MPSSRNLISSPWTPEQDVTLLIPCKGEDCRIAQRAVPHLRPYVAQVQIIRDKSYGEAIKAGLTGVSTAYTMVLDGDGQHTRETLRALLHAFAPQRHAMLIGRQGRRGFPRSVTSRLLNFTASILAGRRIPDFGSGARVFRTDVARCLLPHLPDGFDFNAALTFGFILAGYPVAWTPVPVLPRTQGRSFVRPHDGIRTVRTLLKLRWAQNGLHRIHDREPESL